MFTTFPIRFESTSKLWYSYLRDGLRTNGWKYLKLDSVFFFNITLPIISICRDAVGLNLVNSISFSDIIGHLHLKLYWKPLPWMIALVICFNDNPSIATDWLICLLPQGVSGALLDVSPIQAGDPNCAHSCGEHIFGDFIMLYQNRNHCVYVSSW